VFELYHPPGFSPWEKLWARNRLGIGFVFEPCEVAFERFIVQPGDGVASIIRREAFEAEPQIGEHDLLPQHIAPWFDPRAANGRAGAA
jgi:hypothetical protein